MNTPQELRRKIADLETNLCCTKAALAEAEASCAHNWVESVYDPIITPGYDFSGDPVGTCGIDRRLPCYVPAKTTKRWYRICKNCDKKEYTTSITTQTIENPKFYG